MAKFGDYEKQNDKLEGEIDEASTQQKSREDAASTIPDRFKGKSAEEIAQSYIELEKLNSRQSQELGNMRTTLDQFVANSVASATPRTDEPKEESVTLDDFYDDVEGTVSKIADKASSGRIQELENKLLESEARARLAELDNKFKGWKEEINTPEFKNWVQESSYRQNLVQKADNYDFDAASEILGIYYDLKVSQSRDELLDSASLETSGAEHVSTEEYFSREDLEDKRIAAKRGDQKADRWLRENAEAIALAYEEGRIK